MRYMKYMFLLVVVFTLSSCRPDPDNKVSMIKFLGGNVINFQMDVDDITTYELEVTYEDGSKETILFTEEMVLNTDFLLEKGVWDIEVTYLDETTVVTFQVYETDLDLEIMEIFRLAVQENVDMTYQEWLDSIKGEDGEDGRGIEEVSILSGELIVKYTYGTTVNLGQVVGDTGQTGAEGPKGEDNMTNYHIVNFYSNNGFLISSQMVMNGEDAVAPQPVITDGYTFDTWDTVYVNVQDDLDVYPITVLNTYTASFVWSGDPIPDVPDIEHGTSVDDLPTPEIVGHTFLGWFDSDLPGASRVYEHTPIYNDITLHAVFELEEYTIAFDSNGGNYIPEYDYHYGELVVRPLEPSRDDFFFNGWYYDEERSNPVDFDSVPYGDMILYADWIQFEYTNHGSHISIDGLITDNNVVHIPESIELLHVLVITDSAFRNSDFHSIHLPDTISVIQSSAFRHNTELADINLPNSITEIGSYLFQGCTSLEQITLPTSLNQIPSNTFEDSGLTSIVLHEGIITIGHYAFMNSKLSSVTLPSTLDNINPYAFKGTNIVDLDIPEGVQYLGQGALSHMPYLETVSIPSTMVSIDP